jgi:patatin-like phospholipase/acyl hydrolase
MIRKDPGQEAIFRVLALDGGGIRGIFTASFLATLEDLSGARVADHFDLIVGSSTGGIIGMALALGTPARKILELYLEQGRRIFARPRWLGMLLRPKYDSAPLAAALRQFFDGKTLNDALTPICVTSYELTNSYPRVWKDDHAEDLRAGGDEPAWKIALATSSAPIYFPGAQVAEGDSHVDGGLFANNPTLVGLAEAVRYFGQPLPRIRVLSVGAGERAERLPFETVRRMGLWQWKTTMYEHMLIGQARIAHEIAKRLLTPGQYERVNVPLEQPYPFDDYDAARTLIEPGAQAARTRFLDLRRRFFFAAATLGRRQKRAVTAPALRRRAKIHRVGI